MQKRMKHRRATEEMTPQTDKRRHELPLTGCDDPMIRPAFLLMLVANLAQRLAQTCVS